MKNEKSNSKHYPNLALSILTAKDENPIGVIVPLTDWEKLKPSLQPESPLYKLMLFLAGEMANTSSNAAENDDENEKQDSAEEIFILYKNELCTENNMFIQEYADKKVLIRLNPNTSGYQFIQQLN
jgi:hypothetical protein